MPIHTRLPSASFTRHAMGGSFAETCREYRQAVSEDFDRRCKAVGSTSNASTRNRGNALTENLVALAVVFGVLPFVGAVL